MRGVKSTKIWLECQDTSQRELWDGEISKDTQEKKRFSQLHRL